MLRPYLFFVRIAVLVSCVLPLGVWIYNAARTYDGRADASSWTDLWFKLGYVLLACVPVALAMLTFPRRWTNAIERVSDEQGKFLDAFPEQWINWGIIGSAGLSLLIELAAIRWQGAVFEIFAFYKNLGLLACFLGLGLGYSLSARPQIPLLLSIPLFAWQFIVLISSRYGPENWGAGILRALPMSEQLQMGFVSVAPTVKYLAVLLLLSLVFVMNALAFLPIGQLCGRLLDRRPRLQAYGLNLLGSLAGVGAMFVLSMLWTPPAVWFAVCFLLLLLFQSFDRRTLVFGMMASLVAIVGLVWPATPLWEPIHTPYQLIERGPGEHGMTLIKAAGYYYQRIHDFTACERDPERQWIPAYYSLPYRIYQPAGSVAIVGAGTGNDVAMALRMGAEHVDAIEIDPAIMEVGKHFHPDDPYHSPKVNPIVNDARSFLRTTDKTYNMIVYGLLDSHTLLSHGSSVRLDSFVYTVEAFREARERLKDGGVLSLSFAVIAPEQGRKIFLMLQQAFDGVAPVCIVSEYDGAVTFLERKGQPIELPADLIHKGGHFEDASALYANPKLTADVSTDDWPFFYMPHRVYPMSYMIVVGLILLLSVVLVVPFFQARPHFGQLAFFFLGAGFMLVETKGITELGLTFGNTWQVIGIVIGGILFMAFLANLVVQRIELRSVTIPFILLLCSLLFGVLIMKNGGFPPTAMGRLAAIAVLTCPMFFSGMVFSTLLQSSDDVSGAMATNLIGAMFGGLLEYNSMYFGFLFLYWIAMALYAAAFLSSFVRRGTT